jgi:hypothetical protein
MRKRLAGLLAGFAVTGIALIAGSTPAVAAPARAQAAAPITAQVVHPMQSTSEQAVHFYNNGWFWAYADIWGYDSTGKEIYHDWSGTVGHTGNRWFHVPAGVAKVYWEVRYDPGGWTIHEQNIDPWYNFNDFCGGKHATIYVGGLAGNPDDYDLHCSNW